MPLDPKQERTLSKLWNNGREVAIGPDNHTLDDSTFFTLLVRNDYDGQAAHFATIMTSLYQLDNFERLQQAQVESNNLYDFADINVQDIWYQVPDFARSLIEMMPLALGGSIFYHDQTSPDDHPCPAIALSTAGDAALSDPCVAALIADPTSQVHENTPWLIATVLRFPDVDTGTGDPPNGTIDGCCDGSIIIIDPPSGGWPPGGGGGLPPGVRPPSGDGGVPPGNIALGGSSPEKISTDCDSHIFFSRTGTNSAISLPEALTTGDAFDDLMIGFGVQSFIPLVPILDIADDTIKDLIVAELALVTEIPAHSRVIEVEIGYSWVSLWDVALSIPLPIGVPFVIHLKRAGLPPKLAMYKNGESTTTNYRVLRQNSLIKLGSGFGRIDVVPFNYSAEAAYAEQWQHEVIPFNADNDHMSLNARMYPAIGLNEAFEGIPITDTPYIKLAICGATVDYPFNGYFIEGGEYSFTSDPTVTHKNFDFLASLQGGDRWPTAGGAFIADIDEVQVELFADEGTFSIDTNGYGPGIYMNTTFETDANVLVWASAQGGDQQIAFAQSTSEKHRWWIKLPATLRDEIWFRSTFTRNYSLRVTGVHQVSTDKRFVEDIRVTYADYGTVLH